MVFTESYLENNYLTYDDGYDSFNKKKGGGKPRKKFNLKKLGNIAKNVGLFGIGAGAIAAGAAIGAMKRKKKKKNKPVPGFGLLSQNPAPSELTPDTSTPATAGAPAPNAEADNLAQGASNDLSQINDSTTPDPAKAAAAESHQPAYVPPSDDSAAPSPPAADGQSENISDGSTDNPAASDESGYDEDYSRWSGRGRRFVSQYYGYNDTKTGSASTPNTQASTTTGDAEKVNPKDKKAGISADALIGFGAMIFVAAISFYIVISATKEVKVSDTHKFS